MENIVVNGKKVNEKGKDYICIKTKTYTQVNGGQIKNMAKEYMFLMILE